MPDDTSAKPDVGSDAGQPMTKLAALNGVCWPTRISPALTSPSTTASTSASRDGDLEVLGRVAVGDRDRLVEVGDEHAAAVDAERRPGRLGAHRRQVGELAGELGVDRVGERGRRRHEHDRRVGAVLGLDQQVGGQPDRVGLAVGDHEALGRAEQHHRRHAVALHLDLGARHRRRSRADDLAHARDRLGAERQRGDAGRAVDAEHVGDAELAAHDEHRRVDRAAAARHRRHDEHDPRHAGDDRRHAELVGDARVARLPGRHEQPGRRDRRDLLADAQPRLGLEAPVASPGPAAAR